MDLLKKSQGLILLGTCLLLLSTYLNSNELSVEESQKEVALFKNLVINNSSYVELNQQRFKKAFEAFEKELSTKQAIDKQELTRALGCILAEIGDRHSKVKLPSAKEQEQRYFLPFQVAPWKDKHILALSEKRNHLYDFFLPDYPVLTAIAGIEISDWLKHSVYRHKYAPSYSKHARNVEGLFKELDFLLEVLEVESNKNISFTFSSIGVKKDTTIYLHLESDMDDWEDRGGKAKHNRLAIWEESYQDFFQYNNGIAYLAIPVMLSQKEAPEYFKWLEKQMTIIKDSDALIIDVRDNIGGTRDILKFLGPYFISPNDGAWIGNIAQLRTNPSVEIIPEMHARGLYSESAYSLSNEREAISQFACDFQVSSRYDRTKFSQNYYMLINSTDHPLVYYYDKPVFILINEKSFSAASVFAGALKGIENIKLAGVCTDGSSGLVKTYRLNKSGIEVSFSHMLSFQRDGRIFDGVGTQPDIVIEPSLNQILGREDYQLDSLVQLIQNSYLLKNL